MQTLFIFYSFPSTAKEESCIWKWNPRVLQHVERTKGVSLVSKTNGNNDFDSLSHRLVPFFVKNLENDTFFCLLWVTFIDIFSLLFAPPSTPHSGCLKSIEDRVPIEGRKGIMAKVKGWCNNVTWNMHIHHAWACDSWFTNHTMTRPLFYLVTISRSTEHESFQDGIVHRT